MTRRSLYWFGGALFIVLQIDFWIASWPSGLASWSLLGSTMLGAAYLADMAYQHGERIRSPYWFSGALLIILLIDIWIAPWHSPGLVWWLLTGSMMPSAAYFAVLAYQHRDRIRYAIRSLRRQ